MTELTSDTLRELFEYDPDTGVFTRRVARKGWFAGTQAGCKTSRGYVMMWVAGKLHRAHRLAWLYVHGAWPAADVDHMNGDRADNRIANLRLADAKLNAENRRHARPDNMSGLMGVRRHWRGVKWQARIDVGGGKQKSLGLFDSPEAAHAAYVDAKRKMHAGCTM